MRPDRQDAPALALLSTARRGCVPDDVALVVDVAGDGATAGAVIAGHGIVSVLQLAASIDVAESLTLQRANQPLRRGPE